MESRNEFYVHLSSKANSTDISSNKNTGFTKNIKPTLQFQDEFDVVFGIIIFELKTISIEKGDRNYGLELATHFTNKDGIFRDGYNITYVSQNDIYSDSLEKFTYNLNNGNTR